jgi:hypothetical protein
MFKNWNKTKQTMDKDSVFGDFVHLKLYDVQTDRSSH